MDGWMEGWKERLKKKYFSFFKKFIKSRLALNVFAVQLTTTTVVYIFFIFISRYPVG